MIKMITNEKQLSKHIRYKIEDSGIEVNVDPKLTKQEYIGIKVDDYYSDLRLKGETSKSVDYVVVVDCKSGWNALYILEFKNVKSPGQFTTKDIQEKFSTTINNFLKQKFHDIFENDRFKYKTVKLYLVTTAYKKAQKYGSYQTYLDIHAKMNAKDTLTIDRVMSEKIYCFRGMRLIIEKEIPPNPVIRQFL